MKKLILVVAIAMVIVGVARMSKTSDFVMDAKYGRVDPSEPVAI